MWLDGNIMLFHESIWRYEKFYIHPPGLKRVNKQGIKKAIANETDLSYQ